ncbi:Hypothetical protein DEACI_2903 [Acididesulfobacillus acetoxydans]|uniref:Uncharacterized protein n=1 Tax=Acididesulfobacillus acetoxydans TaxID=1561005 RepID=A0A8S0X658_9FIRM|nr:Hypothetical protein DEACI_2903 [Acididesulfobacillus acetoxydans]CEJ07552.1 Hypothetical protein DEACI_2018 [Acididesulfobacillus acetoxydans]
MMKTQVRAAARPNDRKRQATIFKSITMHLVKCITRDALRSIHLTRCIVKIGSQSGYPNY